MRRSVAGVASSTKSVRGINCQVGLTGGRPTRLNSPNTKSITPYVLSHAFTKQVHVAEGNVSDQINQIARGRYCCEGTWQALITKWAILVAG
eukprot:6212371-Pleurochrysis_carterae.AAC.4